MNFGLADHWELVIEGRNFFQLEGVENRHYTMRDTALSVKHVLREGTLQDRTGPSVGLEVGVLLPGIGVDSGVGAAFAGLLSQRWSSFTLHVNDDAKGARAEALIREAVKFSATAPQLEPLIQELIQ